MSSSSSSRVAIVTGSNRGIGFEIASILHLKGFHVVFACRSVDRAADAISKISRDGSSATALQLDLSESGSVRSFVDNFTKSFDRLDVLVNNAAIVPASQEFNSEGHELSFATNVLGPYLLSRLLLTLMIETSKRSDADGSRMVHLASNYAGGLRLDDLMFAKRPYEANTAYQQSKQANRMLSKALSELIVNAGGHHREDGTPLLTSNACHPGVISTGLLSDLGFGSMGSDTHRGAITPVYLATSKAVSGVTGKFFDDKRERRCRFSEDMAGVEELQRTVDGLLGLSSTITTTT